MANTNYPDSGLPIRRTVELLPTIFQSEANAKFMSAVVDPLTQPGTLDKTVGYIGRRYGKTFNSTDVYLDTDQTLRSRYQLEPGVVVDENKKIKNFYDYLDFKNQLKFFNNDNENDNKITDQEHYTWNPPIDWDKFINYREYYWVPEFPPDIAITGQAQSITSTYRISLGANSYVFTPDGQTNNPTLTLYRGQTYKFNVNIPGHPFFIRTNLDVGVLFYNPAMPYSAGQIAVFDGKIWKAKVNISVNDGSSIDENSQDWELVDVYYDTFSFDYNNGVTGAGKETGTITFEVPLDAPDLLYYQSAIDPNFFGKFLIANVESNTKIDVEKEIIGKETYISSNGITLSNGMVIRFQGQVIPETYTALGNSGKYVVEGVGTSIRLVSVDDLVISPIDELNVPEVLFDDGGFDTEPFDDASLYPANKDYLTINRASADRNSWSRYNRWFHRSVLDYAHSVNNSDFAADEASRAKRPIIEFIPDIKIYNHGEIAKSSVDFIDDFTTDVFSVVEGSIGYIVDGESLFEGARVLITADTDNLVNNQIYRVKIITHNNKKQITLIKESDGDPVVNECLLVKRGKNNRGLMYHYNGDSWIKSQTKTKVNQSPLFDLFDENEISFGDQEVYPVNTFIGTPIVSYKIGNGPVDSELGFSLSYLNIDNVGDIQFNFNLDSDSFDYKIDREILTKKLATGFYRSQRDQYANSWTSLDRNFAQPVLDTIVIVNETDTIISTAIDWNSVEDAQIKKLLVLVNGIKSNVSYVRTRNKFVFSKNFSAGDTVTFKIYSDIPPDTGYYEIPLGLEKNPLNANITNFTLGQASDHLGTALELKDEIVGIFPGSSNLRDISQYQQFAKRFLKHSGSASVAMILLCDKDINIIKSLQFAKRSYTDFKNSFIKLSDELYLNQEPRDFVDTILNEISNNLTSANPFSNSDMVGSGAYTVLKYTVEDEGIKTFALSEKFDLETVSERAVYVYQNSQQLIHGIDYTFNSTFGFVLLNIDLAEGDEIEIREYVSTAVNFIPSTPTKLGLYKKYLPMKFLDDTYAEPKEVIQGHDGSITTAYGDFRDDILLELELRIYNNIKQQYDENVFDIDRILGGYYGNAEFTKRDLDKITNVEFLKWISDTNIDYINNNYIDTENPFTYTYSNMTDPSRSKNLPGYWRGVYEWFYDTTRPHTCPWEMLGFSEKPDWWESEYGPAPYTSNNLILWEDLRDGIVRQGLRKGIYDRYKRSSLMTHIPVDADGNLLDPLNSSLANDYSLINNQGPFVLGDRGPVEFAWRSSSEWPYAVVISLCLLKPFKFITDNFNKSNVVRNKINQITNIDSKVFFTVNDLVFYEKNKTASGLHLYVVDYLKNKTLNTDILQDKIKNIDVRLASRNSGFVDAAQQKYVLDSKNPKASSSSIFVPVENYDIIFNVSSPFGTVAYSGILIEKSNRGWKLSGYDREKPIFYYYQPVQSQSDSLITVGGVSEDFVDWIPNQFYGNGIIARYQGFFYRSLKSHNSGDSFEKINWQQLPSLPLKNAVTAFNRRTFNTIKIKELPYDTVFSDIQTVVDFILGYQEYLKSIGFVFDSYNTELKEPEDWNTSIKEFMFWSRHNWSIGSLIALSPAAKRVNLVTTLGVADNLLDSFYDYQVLKNDGTPLNPSNINVTRSFRTINISTADTNDGIYFVKFNMVLKENITIFSDRTVFNDVIYDKPTGYRQERIKSRGFRTVDWDGDYTSPGFIFDSVDISVWQPFTDYKLGDIVAYKSYYWTSKVNQLGTVEFDDKRWTKLDSTPTKGLVSNFDYRITQFEDYYEADTSGIGSSQRDLARHAIGYQQREYLQNLAEDEVTQFKLYQGFIREKGTANAIVKVFDKLSRTSDDSVVLKEEWAFKLGDVGGIDQTTEYEFQIDKDKFVVNPQPILLDSGVERTSVEDQYYRIYSSSFTLRPIPFTTQINPLIYYDGPSRNAGYVKLDHIDISIKSRDEILNLNIDEVKDNSNIWITFDKNSWTVLRYNEDPFLSVAGVIKEGQNIRCLTNRPHRLSADDIVGIQIQNLTGFFKLLEVTNDTFVVTPTSTDPVEIVDSSSAALGLFRTVRYSTYESMNKGEIALLKQGSKLWVDDAGSDTWEVVEKTKQYIDFTLLEYGITDPRGLGKAVLYIDSTKQIAASLPESNFVMIYTDKVSAGFTNIGLKQIIPAPDGFESATNGVFGEVLAVSPDYKWLAVASPRASGVKSTYREELLPIRSYLAGEIVLWQGRLWKAKVNIRVGDGSSINFNSDDWEPATLVEANSIGRNDGYLEQGMVTLYTYNNQQWEPSISLVSPRQEDFEQFGSSVSIGVSGNKYYMSVSAPGSLDSKGRVYLYYYNGTSWSYFENTSYMGLYDPTPGTFYPVSSIVWYENNFYEALYDNYGDGSTISVESNDWKRLDSVSTQFSLPTNISVDDDGSTLIEGLLTPSQQAELVKQGDRFGHSTTMSRDGSILVVSTPTSDGQYFANYRGVWKPYNEYKPNDVVKYQGGYHKFSVIDSANDESLNNPPDAGNPWVNVGDSTYQTSGKIYIYKRDENNRYNLVQTITEQNINQVNDSTADVNIMSGDEFGFALDIDSSGRTLVVSSPKADVFSQTQGAVYVFKTNDLNDVEFRLVQKLTSFEYLTNEYFGSAISISPNTERIVVGAKNSPFDLITRFNQGTTFDKNKTVFKDSQGFPGQAYVFERKSEGYFLVEKLDTDFIPNESFGESLDCVGNVIVVGSPRYKVEDSTKGNIRLFKKPVDINSLKTIAEESQLVDINKIKNVELYNNINDIKLADIDIIDGYKMKILGVADQEITWKTPYDPAIYILATTDQVIDESQAWYEKNVGRVWWDLSTTKFINYEQGDLAYRIGNWNVQAAGSTVDVYEWIESLLLPSEWSLLADTVEGLAEGISGQPKHPDDSVYNTKILFNPNSGEQVGTKYYFWVKNKNTLPESANRKISISAVANYISSPIGTGLPFVALIDTDKILAYNLPTIISSDTALLNIEYLTSQGRINQSHKEYQLLTEGIADSLPADILERKWLDSLVGYDQAGNAVPDISIPQRQRYGLKFRPRQSMFVDKAVALEGAIEYINNILITRPFTDLVDFVRLGSVDGLPNEELNEYDVAIDTLIDLSQVGTTRIRKAEFSVNIINGEVDTIDIINPGFGYRNVPYIEIEGTGSGAKAEVTIDNQGKINSITVVARGKKYTSALVKIRAFSVLIKSDSSYNNFWSIYSWDDVRRTFFRSKSQGYDVTRYWEYVDWWAEGFDSQVKVTKEITNIYEEPTISVEVGQLIRIKEYSGGGWAVIQKTEDGAGNLLSNYNLVGRKHGTLQIIPLLYNSISNRLGYDGTGAYDSNLYDIQPIKELRIILDAVKNDIFVDDLRVEWNKLFFNSVKYALAEQNSADWLFKTSFLNAIHNVGDLDQRPTYKNDNLDSYKKYIEEIKPYKTTIREYTSRYTEKQNSGLATTDFDLPAAYSTVDGKILPVNEDYNRFNEYPWKSWDDNKGYNIIAVEVANGGSGYVSAPTVLIEGDGQGATGIAYVSNGQVRAVRIINEGSGYTKTPTVLLVGGNGSSPDNARAVAILGKSLVRTFDLNLKFDRISKTGTFTSYSKVQQFTATGSSAVFELAFAPKTEKRFITVTLNNQIVLSSQYAVDLYKSSVDEFDLLRGKIRFLTPPKAGDQITVEYEFNSSLLDSVDRINRYYAPTSGMLGKETNQLMTGIDFGGVRIQGTTFDVTGGWDALPWFVDNWDSVESSSDFYYAADGSTTFVVLPFTPASNQAISIYLKRETETKSTRIDDPAWTPSWDSSVSINPSAQMPTFIGDGSTNVVEIGSYVSTQAGDTLIFRTLESDGSVTIVDANLLDTRITGGSLSNIGGAYVNATGTMAEEISIDGDKFISPDQVPAPEENVPGQVLDSLSFKVFTTEDPGAAHLQNKVIIADGTTKKFNIGLNIFESTGVMVYVNKIKQDYAEDSSINYTIDFVNNQIEFAVAPILGSVIEIISVGIGGISLIDYQEFVADGETDLFLTKAVYDQTTRVLVTVDGQAIDTGFVNSGDFIDTKDRTMIQFGIPPEFRQVVKIICFGSSAQTDSTGVPFIRVNQQTVFYDGVNRNFDLDKFVDLGRNSAQSAIIVEVDGEYLRNVDSNYLIYDGTNNSLTLGTDPEESLGSITSGFIKVYINGQLKRFVVDYIFDGNTNTLTINEDSLEIGDVVLIVNDLAVQYRLENNNIVIAPSVPLTVNDPITITWFSEYPTLDLISDEFSGGKVNYQLPRNPIDVNFIWVYKNGERLTKDRDYYLSLPRGVVYLVDPTIRTDLIKIIQFGTKTYEPPRAFEIYKDMLNNNIYKRYQKKNSVKLTKVLNYYDTTVEVSDATQLSEPILSRNIPGIITINNERIEYFAKSGNVLSQLRRGSLGTAIKESHAIGSYVIDSGSGETISYTDTESTNDFLSDGTPDDSTVGAAQTIGPLDFIPAKSQRNSWYRDTIPQTYGPCDTIEVFVGGKRLRKNPIDLYNSELSASSPAGDEHIEAEFSVDGSTAFVRLTETVPAGTKITVVRKTGRIWYDKGETTASTGISLLYNDTPIAKFIDAGSTELPE